MAKNILSHPISQTVVLGAIVLGVLVCAFPNYIPSLSWGVNYAVHLMLLYLLAGIVMLFLRQPRLTFAFFGGCAFLCVFLKYSVKSNGLPRLQRATSEARASSLPESQELPIEFKVAHFNLTNVDSLPQLTQAVRESDVDLISIHEVTPDWATLLEDSLTPYFDHHHTMVDIGIFGMSIFSRFELEKVDTLHYQDIPILSGEIKKEGESLYFFSVQTEPALNEFSLKRLNEHLAVLGGEVLDAKIPGVVLGDFNAVSWSGEIQSFLDHSGLMESRTGFMPFPFSSSSSFQVPLDHIFYSHQLQCLGFENILTSNSRHLGITGKYSRKNLTYHAKKTAR